MLRHEMKNLSIIRSVIRIFTRRSCVGVYSREKSTGNSCKTTKQSKKRLNPTRDLSKMRHEDCDLETSPFSDPENIMKRNMSMQWALQDAMQTARDRGEFAGGVHTAAEQLDQNPDDVVLCVLVENKRADPGIQIHCRLIEAFCWEFPIPVIKVDSSTRLMFLAGYSWNHPDTIHCVLIKGKDNIGQPLQKLLRFSQQIPAPMLKLT